MSHDYSNSGGGDRVPNKSDDSMAQGVHVEQVNDTTYTEDDDDPKLHLTTWVALISMYIYQLVVVVNLQGPSAVVCLLVAFRISK